MFSLDNNNYNYDTLFSIEEIDKLLNELKEEHVSLTKKTPSMIRSNTNIVERKKEEIKFGWLNDLYVLPLLEFAKRVSLSEGKGFVDHYTSSDSSITDRMLRLRNFLISKGYPTETVMQLVPKTTEEIDVLLQASKLGFNLGFDNISDLSNQSRVERAKNYLIVKANIVNGREVDNGRGAR